MKKFVVSMLALVLVGCGNATVTAAHMVRATEACENNGGAVKIVADYVLWKDVESAYHVECLDKSVVFFNVKKS